MSIFLIENEDGTLEYPVASINVRRKFPNTSFPKLMGGYSNPDMGIYEFVRTDPPESKFTHDNVQEAPIKQGNQYVQQWGSATPKTQQEIDGAWAMAYAGAKRYAGILIDGLYPDWKQRNMTMRVVTLQGKDTLTADEQAELVEISAAWDKIDAIRAASDLVEQDMQAMGIDAALAYDVASSDRWPA